MYRRTKSVLTSQTKTVMANAGGTYANLFDAHPPFQIDGNFGTVSGMLLQNMDLIPLEMARMLTSLIYYLHYHLPGLLDILPA